MADADDNVGLGLAREIRAEQTSQGGDLTTITRQLSELRGDVVTALGMAAHSNVVVEEAGQRFDEFADGIGALKRRVQEWEAAR